MTAPTGAHGTQANASNVTVGQVRSRASCRLINVARGGYEFRPLRSLKMSVSARLRLKDSGDDVPLTTAHGRFRFGPDPVAGLGTFLSILDVRGLWALRDNPLPLACEISIGGNAKTATVLHVEVPPPVPPYRGEIGGTNAASIGTSGSLRYVGTGAAPFIGRMLHKPIGGMRLFKYGGRLTTGISTRGFDCITFAGAVFGAQSHMDGNGKKLADHLGGDAVSAVPDGSTSDTVAKYFEVTANRTGTHLMWKGGHVVVVVNGVVHEFNVAPKNGYNSTDVAAYLRLHRADKWSLLKEPGIATT